uniref:Uncharacterized protein n=1 Tax=Ananas comosus var. bracteatus TaxID=296719 RepID=A0A6V7NSR6_ANACO|nr:unnamed protein product [Ananas comosus var. bracteatus]
MLRTKENQSLPLRERLGTAARVSLRASERGILLDALYVQAYGGSGHATGRASAGLGRNRLVRDDRVTLAADNVTSERGCDSVGFTNLRFYDVVVVMPITRSKSVGADNMANLEEVETSVTSGSGEVRELRSQLAALTNLVTQEAAAAQQ